MKLFAVAFKDIIQLIRDWKTIVFLILMPILFTVFFILAFESGYSEKKLPEKEFTVGILNNSDNRFLTGVITQYLDNRDPFTIEELGRATELTVRNRLSDGTLDIIVLFSPELSYAEQLEGVSLVIDESRDNSGTVIPLVKTALAQVENSLKIAHISKDFFKEEQSFTSGAREDRYLQEAVALAGEAWKRKNVAVTVEKVDNGEAAEQSGNELTAPTQTSPGMIVQFAIFGLITTAMVIVLERKTGTYDRVLTTPVTKAVIVGGHATAMFITICFQELVLVLFGYLVYKVPYFQTPGALLIMVVSIALWASGLGLFIGAVSKQEEQVVVLSLVFMFTLSVFGGAWFPLELGGETFAHIGRLLPSTWAMTGLQNIIVRGMGAASVLFPATVLLLYGGLFYGLAVWRFK